MNKLLVICGPTATGKTKLGLQLAKKFNGEIMAADSRQVYRYMNIGTGKDVPVSSKFQIPNSKQIPNSQPVRQAGKFQIGYYLFEKIPVWLMDIIEPNYRFSVADYKKCAEIVIEDILKRKKLPILVGGTGFYIKAITEGIETIGVEPDWQLREKLSSCQIDELQIMLRDIDPERYRGMNESDRQNPRRLIRAIEIARWKCEVRSGKLDKEVGSGRKKSHFSHQYPASQFQHPTSILFIGLTAPNEVLYQRIDQRVDERVRGGIEEEIRGLLEKGYTWESSALGSTLAYREWQDYFRKVPSVSKVSRGEDELNEIKKKVIQQWKFDEHNYARRQMTWFKKDPRINWFDMTQEGWQQKVEKLVKSWYSKANN